MGIPQQVKVKYREMANQLDPTVDPGQPPVYRIRIRGHLGQQWAARFEGLTLTLEENGDTLFTGPVVDQAALHGLLRTVRDLGLLLLEVTRVEPRWADAPDVEP
jgi:hypothetical protein